jgi:hypothetical protein
VTSLKKFILVQDTRVDQSKTPVGVFDAVATDFAALTGVEGFAPLLGCAATGFVPATGVTDVAVWPGFAAAGVAGFATTGAGLFVPGGVIGFAAGAGATGC